MDAYIDLDADTLAEHHICCALGDPKHELGVAQKKAWLKRRFKEGLVFRKLDVRGKVFIEYAPSEVAWRPIVAPGWLTIHCLWVSGRFAGQGHGRALMQSCIDDARTQGKSGVVLAAGKTKRPFLSDPKFLRKTGFEVVDEVPGYQLYAYWLDREGSTPRFAPSVGREGGDDDAPFVARYTDQCPFNAHWAEQMADTMRDEGCDVSVERITTRAKAQRVASPLGTFGLERDRTLVTHHLNTDNAVRRLLQKLR